MTTDTDMLETNIKNLERENRELRITLRDRFAMAALPEFIVASFIVSSVDAEIDDPEVGFSLVATLTYMMADAMMEARK